MKNSNVRGLLTVGLLSASLAATAGAEVTPAPSAAAMPIDTAVAPTQSKRMAPQEPAGFITGGVIGGLAAGPVGALIGAGVGTWLGGRVHRAAEATQAETRAAALRADAAALRAQNSSLVAEKGELAETNRALTARLDVMSQRVDAEQTAEQLAAQVEAAKVLDGLQGDVLFKTGTAELTPDIAESIRALAAAVAKSPALKVRVDGYADGRGAADLNLKLSTARANAVRDLFIAAGVDGDALEVNAYGKSRSVAADSDGYALERRVRLTLQAEGVGTAGATASALVP